MEWYNVVVALLGGSGVVGGVIALFTMKQKKEGLVIDNLSRVIDELRNTHEQFKKETDEKFIKMECKIEKMEQKDRFQLFCINKAFRCKLPKDNEACPVVKEFEKANINNDSNG